MNTLWFCILIILGSGLSGCWQTEWNSGSGGYDLPGGRIVSIHYESPRDSGMVQVAFLSRDSIQCFKGFKVENYFPTVAKFDITTRWMKCDPEPGSIADSTTVLFDGNESEIVVGNQRLVASYKSLFLISVPAAGDPVVREILGEKDVTGIPRAAADTLLAVLHRSSKSYR